MPKATINDLYSSYRSDPALIDPLLVAIRSRAMQVLHDADAAQNFVLSVWQALPTLRIDSSFEGWLSTRLRWARSALHATRPESVIMTTPVVMHTPDVASITDPLIRTVANLLLEGYTQVECAARVHLSEPCLRKRLQRYRDSVSHSA